MALSSRIEEIIVREEGGLGWSYTLKPTNFNVDLTQVNWNQATDEALDASLRQNFRGFRGNISITWEKVTDTTVSGASTIGDLLDDIVTSLATNKDDGIEISLDSTNYDVYVPTNLRYGTTYTNQIGRGNSSFEFQSQQLITSIPAYLEAPSV